MLAPNTSSLVLKASLGLKEDFGLFPYWLLATTVLFKGGDVRLYTSLPPTGSLQLSLTCSTGGELEKKKNRCLIYFQEFFGRNLF